MYNNPIEGSVEVINRLQEIGKKVYFVTNNSTKTRPEFLEKAHSMKFNVTADAIVSTAYGAAQYLKNRNFTKKVYLIGSAGLAQELDAVNIAHTDIGPDLMPPGSLVGLQADFVADPDIGAVLVGFDEHFAFPKMFKAASYLNDPEVLFIATNTDERFPMPACVVPGTGSIVISIETCAARKPTVIGKPNPSICESLIKDNGIVPERTLMIGDRCNTDILLGKNCNFQTLLVGTGIHNLDDVAKWRANDSSEDKLLIPDTYLPRLGDLLQFL